MLLLEVKCYLLFYVRQNETRLKWLLLHCLWILFIFFFFYHNTICSKGQLGAFECSTVSYSCSLDRIILIPTFGFGFAHKFVLLWESMQKGNKDWKIKHGELCDSTLGEKALKIRYGSMICKDNCHQRFTVNYETIEIYADFKNIIQKQRKV